MKFCTNALLLLGLIESAKGDLWRKGMNPGLMLRVDDYSIDAMKRVMNKHFAHELVDEPEKMLPSEYHYEYNSYLPGCSWAIDYENIQYSDLDFRLEDITFELTRMENMWGEIKMDFPSLKYWAVTAT